MSFRFKMAVICVIQEWNGLQVAIRTGRTTAQRSLIPTILVVVSDDWI